MSSSGARNWYRNKGKRKRTSDVQPRSTEGNSGMNSNAMSTSTDSSQEFPEFNESLYRASYYKWDKYFHYEEYKKASSTDKKIQAMLRFITSHSDIFPVSNLENNKPYTIDLKILYKDEVFLNEWNSFKEDLMNNPKHTLNCLGIAINQVMINTIKQRDGMDDAKVLAKLPIAVARVSNYGPVIPLRDLRVNYYGKLISVRGCLMRVGHIKHFAQSIEFSCMACNGPSVVVNQVDGIYTLPNKCVACNGKRFSPVLASLSTKSVKFQVITLQEHLGDELDDKGRIPRTIEVDLIEDLVYTCMPGDNVTVTGIVKIRGNETKSSKANNSSNPFSLYMEAIYILNNKYKSQNKCAVDLDLTVKDYHAIRAIYHEPNIFKLLVHSLCPSIYGHEYIKAGLLLSLFGGSARSEDVRDDIHVLIIGDPGLGKSQMLQACARVAPKGVYVCGSSSTSTGLTVTLVKDNSTGDFVLEPGALVLADKGSCCIDEFDKMSTQHQALLEAMEQQSVSLAKSGMICCLPARTSILAAANPAGGRYNRSKTIIENLNMNQPLLSRFDLIYILLDKPNEHMDNLLSEHVMAVHEGTNKQTKDAMHPGFTSLTQSPRFERTLRQKLRLLATDEIDPVPHSILRNYIAYAKQYIKPIITPAASEILQKFYLECRAREDNAKFTPMTPRQLGALIRLTQARAKLELRDEATANDAVEVVQIIQYSTQDVAIKPAELNHSLLSGGGKLTNKKVKAFINLLTNRATATGKKVFTTIELKDFAQNVVIDDFNALIAKLNENGVILKRGPNQYLFTSND